MEEYTPASIPPARFALLFTIAGLSALLVIGSGAGALSLAGVTLQGPLYLVMAIVVMPLATRFAVRLGGRAAADEHPTPMAG